jgi:hypothetical protein
VNWPALSNQEFFETATGGYYPLGCTIAARRCFLNKIIPFPSHHDKWAAYCAAIFGDIKAIDEKCICYRRHGGTTTPTVPIKHDESTGIKRFIHRITFVLREITHNRYDTVFIAPDAEYAAIERLLQLLEETESNLKADGMKQYYEYLTTINTIKYKNCFTRISALRRLYKKGMYQKFRSESKKLYYYDCMFLFLNSFRRKKNR